MWCSSIFFFFFFNDTATTEIYTLSLHDALPICLRNNRHPAGGSVDRARPPRVDVLDFRSPNWLPVRSEEHTSELQSRLHLVCRLLLEKKKKKKCERMSSLYLCSSSTLTHCMRCR